MTIVDKISVQLTDSEGPKVCDQGPCPSLMKTDKGDVLIQGYTLSSSEREDLDIPEDEDVVSIPEPVDAKIIEVYTNQNE
jgi:archaellum component FlaF (FlaF/FlaG flagellin family)